MFGKLSFSLGCFGVSLFLARTDSLTSSDVTEAVSSTGRYVGVYPNNPTNTITAYDARDYCQSYYYDLATIINEADNAEVVAVSRASGNTASDPYAEVWIGYSDKEVFGGTEGNFVWMDGTQSIWTYWENGEPNDSNGEDCTLIYIGRGDRWNDQDCDEGRNAFVCETGPIEVPSGYTEAVSSTGKYIGVYPNNPMNIINAYEARAYCQEHYYDLATITSDEENAEVVDVSRASGNTGDGVYDEVWIGYSDKEIFGGSEGNYVWMDGDESNYTNWHPGEPNDSNGEDCTLIYIGRGDMWNDQDCDEGRNAFVCLRKRSKANKGNKKEKKEKNPCKKGRCDTAETTQYALPDDKEYVAMSQGEEGTNGLNYSIYGVICLIAVIGIFGIYKLLRYCNVFGGEYKSIDNKTPLIGNIGNNGYQTV